MSVLLASVVDVVVVVSPVLPLPLMHAAEDLRYLLWLEDRPPDYVSGDLLTLAMCGLTRALRQRWAAAIVGHSQIRFGDVHSDGGATFKGIFDVALAREDVACRIDCSASIHQQSG